MTPEAKAHLNIDKMLAEASYILQSKSSFNRTDALGVAVREFPTESGRVDYLHTILRLQTGIFYAQGVKANVIFFDNRPAAPTR